MLKLNHKNLEVWKRSIELISEIYSITDNFPKKEMFGLSNQMRRASISIASNIAEIE
ncbi:MAG: four helix bundle protein [Ignavibacteria bacterium]|nr:four helix bundle protein [Ignavibacteria bacterium]